MCHCSLSCCRWLELGTCLIVPMHFTFYTEPRKRCIKRFTFCVLAASHLHHKLHSLQIMNKDILNGEKYKWCFMESRDMDGRKFGIVCQPQMRSWRNIEIPAPHKHKHQHQAAPPQIQSAIEIWCFCVWCDNNIRSGRAGCPENLTFRVPFTKFKSYQNAAFSKCF